MTLEFRTTQAIPEAELFGFATRVGVRVSSTAADVEQSDRFPASFRVQSIRSSTPVGGDVGPTSVFRSAPYERRHEGVNEAPRPKDRVHGMVASISDASVFARVLDLKEPMTLTIPRGMFPERISEGQTFALAVVRDTDGIAVPKISMVEVAPTDEARKAHARLAALMDRF